MMILGKRGDTIVEVLLAIAVLSVVLGGAYVSSNNSLNAIRQAQERGESLKLAETQLERLKVAAANPATNIFTTPNYFCLDSSIAVRQLATTDRDNFINPNYPAECQISPLGGIVYYVSIDRSVAGNVFTVVSRWDRAGGRGRDEVKLMYRVYK